MYLAVSSPSTCSHLWLWRVSDTHGERKSLDRPHMLSSLYRQHRSVCVWKWARTRKSPYSQTPGVRKSRCLKLGQPPGLSICPPRSTETLGTNFWTLMPAADDSIRTAAKRPRRADCLPTASHMLPSVYPGTCVHVLKLIKRAGVAASAASQSTTCDAVSAPELSRTYIKEEPSALRQKGAQSSPDGASKPGGKLRPTTSSYTATFGQRLSILPQQRRRSAHHHPRPRCALAAMGR